jgi:hypothetical protein
LIVFPIIRKSCRAIRTDNNDLGLTFNKLIVILAQLRHMPLAKRSGKASVKHQQDLLSAQV